VNSRTAIGAVVVAAFGGATAEGCHRAPSGTAPAASVAASAAPSAKPKPPVDRLAPGEITEGTDAVYGITLPLGMKVIAHFPKIAHAIGDVGPEDVANYLRDRVDVSHVELGAVATVFPDARVKGGDSKVILRIEVIPIGRDRTKLVIKDVSPPSEPVTTDDGLTDAERWRRAGYNPDGTLLNPNKLR